MTVQPGVPENDVDVIVVGGGVNGTGVARDVALRGARVALIERNDIAFGASGNSSGMIHGGPRYLTYDPDVTHSSCLDSGHIQRIAPHLLFRIPFLMPVHQGRRGARTMLALLDAFFDAYDKFQPLKHGKPHVRLTARELEQLEPGLVGQTVGGISFDEWGIDGARLCIANALDAIAHGASVLVHTTVTSLMREPNGAVRGVQFRDRLTGDRRALTARTVINATGAWAPLTAAIAGLSPRAARLRPGKGIHLYFDRRLTNYAIAVRAIDGRQVFVEPWQNMTVIGTTDDDYYGDLDRVVATADEVRYLMQAVARVFPAVLDARIIGTWAGVRPTLHAWGKNEDRLSREHEIIDHTKHGAAGLFSMIGGKLASYRIFAEEMTDVIMARLGTPVPCRTHLTPLPGGEELLDPIALARDARIEPIAGARMEYRHGCRSQAIVERIGRNPREADVVCACEPVLEAEVRYVVVNELARTVEDVSRRTRLGLGACGGMRCALRCGAIVAQCRGRSPADGRRDAFAFVQTAARRRAAAIGPAQARQEAMWLGHLDAELGPRAREEDEP